MRFDGFCDFCGHFDIVEKSMGIEPSRMVSYRACLCQTAEVDDLEKALIHLGYLKIDAQATVLRHCSRALATVPWRVRFLPHQHRRPRLSKAVLPRGDMHARRNIQESHGP